MGIIIAGTGHRPKDLPCGYLENIEWAVNVKKDILNFLENNDVGSVISGMALGFDTWLAEAALNLDIPLRVYAPCNNQESKWPAESQKRYRSIIEKASSVLTISMFYTHACMQDRNIRMVDDCDKVLALWTPTKIHGGTWNCIQYAQAQKKEIINIWPD